MPTCGGLIRSELGPEATSIETLLAGGCRPVEMRRPGHEPWNPPRDCCTETFVLSAKTCRESRLFINEHEEMREQPDDGTVFQQCHISEN